MVFPKPLFPKVNVGWWTALYLKGDDGLPKWDPPPSPAHGPPTNIDLGGGGAALGLAGRGHKTCDGGKVKCSHICFRNVVVIEYFILQNIVSKNKQSRYDNHGKNASTVCQAKTTYKQNVGMFLRYILRTNALFPQMMSSTVFMYFPHPF